MWNITNKSDKKKRNRLSTRSHLHTPLKDKLSLIPQWFLRALIRLPSDSRVNYPLHHLVFLLPVQAVLLACHLPLEDEVSLSLLPSPQLLVRPVQEASRRFLTCPTWDLLAPSHPRVNSLPRQAAFLPSLRTSRAAARQASHPCLVHQAQALPGSVPVRALELPDHREEELKGLHPSLGCHQGRFLDRRLGWGISGDMI